MALLEAEGLGLSLGGATPIAGLSLMLPEAGVLAIVGEAGSGKSLLALALAGVLPEDAVLTGSLRLGDLAYPVTEADRAVFRGKRVAYLNRTPGRSLDAVLAGKPELLVCDEPTAGLDPPAQRELLEAIVARCRTAGISLVLMTRDFRLAAAVALEVAVLSGGKIAERGAAGALAEHPKHTATRRLLDAERPRTRTLMRPPIGEPLLEVHGVGLRYGASRLWRRDGVAALSGIGFSVRRGEAVGLLGSAGAGKSSLLRLVAGLGRTSEGHLLFERQRYRGGDLSGEARAGISLVFPDPHRAFNPDLPVGLSMTEPLRLEQQLLVDEQADRLVEAVRVAGLEPWVLSELPGAFSPLDLQRLALARALVGRPKLLILDEPTAELDPVARSTFLVLFNRVRSDHGLTVLFGSRDFEVIRQVADRVLVLEAGHIVEGGKPGELAEAPKHTATLRLVARRYPEPYVAPVAVEVVVVEPVVVPEVELAAAEAIETITAAAPPEPVAEAPVVPEPEAPPVAPASVEGADEHAEGRQAEGTGDGLGDNAGGTEVARDHSGG